MAETGCGAGSGSFEEVHLFVDLSNIWYGARDAAGRFGEHPNAVRLFADNLYRLMASGRHVASATLVTNDAVPEAVLGHFRPLFEVLRVERGATSGREVGADEKLQNAMLLRLGLAAPGVIVLATGDGAGLRRGIGFGQVLVMARRAGFAVEVLAFRRSLNQTLQALADSLGVVVELDDHYRSITFMQNLRSPEPVSLRHRPTSLPRPWTPEEGAEVRRLLAVSGGSAA